LLSTRMNTLPFKPCRSSSDKLIPLQTGSMDVFPFPVQDRITFLA
jgi:hypothetical protein